MELALSLGGDPSKPFSFLDHHHHNHHHNNKTITSTKHGGGVGLGFCMGLGGLRSTTTTTTNENNINIISGSSSNSSSDQNQSVHELDLLPFSPVNPTETRQLQPPTTPPPGFRFPWLNDNLMMKEPNRVPRVTGVEEEDDDGAVLSSSPNSTTVLQSCFQMDFVGIRNKRDHMEISTTLEASLDRGSDDDENGSTRKKLRLSKQQSAFLEESFKEHHTLNPKQKLGLAKQLNLRPRQVEVWFQNRRARTKLKQTEVDCEYLKSCCETLTEENRRLQKEVAELRALKTTSSHPLFMQLPATTLTMCPSCERVVTKPNPNPNPNPNSANNT